MNQQGDSRTQLHTNTNPNVPRDVVTNADLDNGRWSQDELPVDFRNEGAIQTQPPPPPQNQRALQRQHAPGNAPMERVPYGYDKEQQKRIWKDRCLICGGPSHDDWKICDRECYHCKKRMGICGPNVHVGMPCPNTGFNSQWWMDVGGASVGDTKWDKMKIRCRDQVIRQKDQEITDLQRKLADAESRIDSQKKEFARHRIEEREKRRGMRDIITELEARNADLEAEITTGYAIDNPYSSYREREGSNYRSHTSGNHDGRKGRQEKSRRHAHSPSRSPPRPPHTNITYGEYLRMKERWEREMREDGHNKYKASRNSENRSRSERFPSDSDSDKTTMKRPASPDYPEPPPIREYDPRKYARPAAQEPTDLHSGFQDRPAFGQQSPYLQGAATGQSSSRPMMGTYYVSDRHSLPSSSGNEPLMRNQMSRQNSRQPQYMVGDAKDTLMGGADNYYGSELDSRVPYPPYKRKKLTDNSKYR